MAGKKVTEIVKKIAGTIMLPLVMYLIVMAACFSQGKMYFGTWAMWKTLLVDIAVSATCAMGIGLQFKCGRFDFFRRRNYAAGGHHCREYGKKLWK